MEYLLFVGYLILFTWLVTKTRFFTATGLSKPQLIIIFLAKVLAGIFYGWIGLYYGNLAQMQDTWQYHSFGISEYHLLLDHPHEYFTNIAQNPYASRWGDLFGSIDSYWNDLKGNVFVKLLSVFDLLSFGRYYVNVIFYCFISLFGAVAIYKVMRDFFSGKMTALMLACFFIPSFLYWTSGIHKEGILFLGISLIIYHLYFGWKEKKYSFKRWLGIISGLVVLFVFRNFLMMLVVPAIFAWFLAAKFSRYTLATFASVYLLFGILFFTARYIDDRLDFPQIVVNKQQAFLQLQGGFSTVPIKELKPTAVSFLKNTPQAVTLSFLRPYPSNVHDLLSLAAALETALLLILVTLFIFFREKNKSASKNTIYLCTFLSLSILLAIGFSVNNIGAIVRYRSIVIPLLIIPLVAQTDWKRIEMLYSGKNKKTKNALP